MRLADPFKCLLHCHKNVSGHLKKRQKTSHNKVVQVAYNAGEKCLCVCWEGEWGGAS